MVDPDGTNTFRDVGPHIFKFIHGEIVVSYDPLTRQAIEAAYQGACLDSPESQWIDCQQVIQRTWPRLSNCGDELVSAADLIRYRYISGDALQEAQAAGAVFLAAIKESGYTAEAWAIFAEENVVRRKGK